MAKAKRPTRVKLLEDFGGFEAEQIVDTLGYGVCEALVARGAAEWAEETKKRGRAKRNSEGDNRASQ